MELNPNHPVTREMSEQWHKIVGLLMLKFGEHHIEITSEDIARLHEMNSAVAIEPTDDVIHLRLMSFEEGERLARKEGGLPH